MGTTTRQSLLDFKARLKDDEISIIPNEMMKLILDINTDYQERLVSSQERMASCMECINTDYQERLVSSQERMASAMERIATSMEIQLQQTKDVHTKLDTLNTTISGGTTILADAQRNVDRAAIESDLEKLLTKKHNTEWKVLRSKELSRYYRELLQMEPQFVPEKYRSKVYKNQVTRESIKIIHIDESIHNVETQIRIMETQVAEWATELETMKQETTTKLEVLGNQKRNEFETRIIENEEKNIANWKIAFSKITKTYEDEMNSDADQFLLKFTDDDKEEQESTSNDNEQKSQKNVQGRGSHRGRGNRGNQGRFNNNRR